MKTLAEDPTIEHVPVRPGVHARPSGRRVFTLDGAQRCPFCHDAVRSGELLIACGDCGALYHGECHAGRCATLGCPGRASAPASEPIAAPPRGGLRPLGGRTLAFLAILSLGLSAGSFWINLARQEGIGCRAEPIVEVVPLQPRPRPDRSASRVWVELAEDEVWAPTGDYRLRGSLLGEGEVEVIVQLNAREVIRYSALAPAPLDVLLPLRSGANTVEVRVVPARGLETHVSKSVHGH